MRVAKFYVPKNVSIQMRRKDTVCMISFFPLSLHCSARETNLEMDVHVAILLGVNNFSSHFNGNSTINQWNIHHM